MSVFGLRRMNYLIAQDTIGFFRGHIDKQMFDGKKYEPSNRAKKYGGKTMYNTGKLYKNFFVAKVEDDKIGFSVTNAQHYARYHEKSIEAGEVLSGGVGGVDRLYDEFGTLIQLGSVEWFYNEHMGSKAWLPERPVMNLDREDIINLTALAKKNLINSGLIVEG